MHSYTAQKKIKVVEWHRRNGKNVYLTTRQFKLDRKRIREWEKNYDVLLQQNFGKSKLRRKLSNGAPKFSKEVDDSLFELLECERSAGCALSSRLLSEEALRIASQLQLGNFASSSQYMRRWKQRFNVSMRQATNDSQKVPEECADAAKDFRSALGCLQSRHEYTLHNMDQTMVRMDAPANKTNNLAGASRVRIANSGCAGHGFAVALAACASGHKLPAFVILKKPSGKILTIAFKSLRIPECQEPAEPADKTKNDASKSGETTSPSEPCTSLNKLSQQALNKQPQRVKPRHTV
ncbi:hypothetical protein HPB47_018388 [Ixodes persulcatus]|uniref:Uncharacterized protein n=1 Tax=Ixodes persulcatus TaxID=34615 RepID=A0AC60QKV9_IXOPE|nr:hypothetical protein HPB47_018388 [Ixodes persulcatus]